MPNSNSSVRVVAPQSERERSREAAAPRAVSLSAFAALSIAERSDTARESARRGIGRDERRRTGAIRPRMRKSCLLFFPLCSHQKKLEIDRPPLSHPNSRFSISPEKKSTNSLLQVSWDWSCESTVIYRAVSYLDTYMASVGVAELGKYQVRKKEGVEKTESCMDSRRAKKREREIFFGFGSLSELLRVL